MDLCVQARKIISEVPSLQKYTVGGNPYYRVVDSRRINGKPTPVPIKYIGSQEELVRRLLASESLDDQPELLTPLVDKAVLAVKLSSVRPYLDERQWRICLAAEAQALGHGGVSCIAEIANVSRGMIHRGLDELKGLKELISDEGIRKSGAGRKRLRETNPALVKALDALVEPDSRGDPMSPLRWTCKSTRQLTEALKRKGFQVSHTIVAELLHEEDYSLRGNVKTKEGSQHEDRDRQFHYINKQVKKFLKSKQPAISVDCKKKELIGNYKNAGREWRPKGKPQEVNMHDFPDPKSGKVIPYGIYDMRLNQGWVNVGTDHDTAAFAVESIRRWWKSPAGAESYSNANQILICADGGGSNGHRCRLWKLELSKLASEIGLTISVCHLPPGTSKWNKIEHKLFSYISSNWRGQPLVSHETIIGLIGATSTREGLRVTATLDTGTYPIGIKVLDKEMADIPITNNKFHGEWNYSIAPQKS